MCWDAGPMSGGKYTATPVICPQSATEDHPKTYEMNIYPNPSNGQVFVTVPNGVNNISVVSPMGSQLPVKPVWTSNVCQIDLSAYPSGMYYIILTTQDGSRTSKSVMKY